MNPASVNVPSAPGFPAYNPRMEGLWIGFGLFVAFMLILIKADLGSILTCLRELRDHLMPDDDEESGSV